MERKRLGTVRQMIPDFYRLRDGVVCPGNVLRKAVEDTGVEIIDDGTGYPYVEVVLYEDELGNIVPEPNIEISESTLSDMFNKDLIQKISVSMKGVCNEDGTEKYLGNRESRRKEAHKRTVGQTNKSARGKGSRKKRSKQRNK
jgi:hypothetical protein